MKRLALASMALGLAVLAWLLTPDGDRAPLKLCRYVCDQGLCPPCPEDPTPPGRTMAPVPAREGTPAPLQPTPVGDL